MKKTILVMGMAIIMSSCGTSNTEKCESKNCDSTMVQVDSTKTAAGEINDLHNNATSTITVEAEVK